MPHTKTAELDRSVEIKVETLGRIEETIKDAIRTDWKVDPSSVMVFLKDRDDKQTIAQGELEVFGKTVSPDPDNDSFKTWRGTFKVTGYRSSHTPLGLDRLTLHYGLERF